MVQHFTCTFIQINLAADPRQPALAVFKFAVLLVSAVSCALEMCSAAPCTSLSSTVGGLASELGLVLGIVPPQDGGEATGQVVTSFMSSDSPQ